MAGNQVSMDAVSLNLSGMSKPQLYDIMSQLRTLTDQNTDQAKEILVQNPLLTRALFQAQIMLGMVHAPQTVPNIQPAAASNIPKPTNTQLPKIGETSGSSCYRVLATTLSCKSGPILSLIVSFESSYYSSEI